MKKLSFVSKTSLLLAFFFLLDKILALVRYYITLDRFGLSKELDAFNVANNLPDMLFALISGGALGMAFIPILTEHITQKGREDAWQLFSRVANIAFLATIVAAVIVAIFAGQIVKSEIGVAPGFGPAQQELVTQLMRLNLVATIIFSVSGLVMAGLQANQHFLLPAMAPILYNVGQIFGAVFLVPVFGVQGLVYGVIIGAALHLGIQVPGLLKYKFHWTPSLDFKDEGVREVLTVVGPRLLTMFFIQLTFVARDNLASRLDQTGSVSALTYGWMIMQFPETLLGTAIATAMLPTLAEHFSRAKWSQFRDSVERAIRVLVAVTLPVAGILIIVLRPLLAMLGARLELDEAGTQLLTLTAQAYMLTLTGYTLQEIMARSFYARKEAWMPFWGVLIRFAVYVAIGVAGLKLFPQAGAPVLALAELSMTVEAIVMLTWLNRRVSPAITAGGALVRGGLAMLVGTVASYGLLALLPLPAVVSAFVAMAIGGAVTIPFIIPYLRLMLRL